MTDHTLESQHLTDLRSRAASRLAGPADARGSAAGAAGALNVLHALASSPETASDALSLLHELQVHQVELELQAQELQESRAELESALRRQTELYDAQPVGCCTVDARLVLHELNRTGAGMLGVGRDDAPGLSLDAFLDAAGARRLRSAMPELQDGLQRLSLHLTLRPKNGPEQPVLASLARDRSANLYLLTLANAADEPQRHPQN